MVVLDVVVVVLMMVMMVFVMVVSRSRAVAARKWEGRQGRDLQGHIWIFLKSPPHRSAA